MVNSFKLSVAVTLLLLFIQGCTASYTASELQRAKQVLALADNHHIERKNQWRLSTDTPLYIAYSLPTERDYRNRPTHRRAKFQLQAALEDAFVARYAKVQTSPLPLSVSEALLAARLSGSRVLIYPQLLAYPATAESPPPLAKRQKTTLRVLMYDTLSGDILDLATLSSHSALSLEGNTLPSNLFTDAAWLYVKQLAGR